MSRNRNGYWMSPKWFALFKPDDGAGNGGTDAGSGSGGTDGAGDGAGSEDAGGREDGQNQSASGEDEAQAEIARLKAELAKQKNAIDKATKEAAGYKRELRSKQSAEEIAAEEKKAQDEATRQELDALRREVALAKTVKNVMGRLGTDENVSTKIAEYLYGAEDAEAVLDEISKAWTAREKAIRLEYGKVTGPGAGGANGEDAETAAAIKLAKEIGQERARSTDSVREQLKGLIR